MKMKELQQLKFTNQKVKSHLLILKTRSAVCHDFTTIIYTKMKKP